MIDTLIKLLEKFIELAKLRQEDAEKSFQLLIEPIYADLKEVHNDYLQLFEKCQQDCASGIELKVMARQLLCDRLKQETLRRRIQVYVKHYVENDRLSKYHSFFSSVNCYFAKGFKDSLSSELLHELEIWIREDEKNAFLPSYDKNQRSYQGRPALIEMCQRTLKDIRHGWDVVSLEYAKINVKVVAL